MEVRYHKDYRHNFLILKSIKNIANSYQSHMMTRNEISGFLPCKERHINGEQLFYYEITSKQSLASLYECGGIDMAFLCRLFIQLKTTWDAMASFLLEEKYLVLMPEYVFMDVETKEFSFLYYPEETEEDNITLLLEFLVKKVDSEDERAVDAIYKMMELAEKEQFVIDEIISWFEQDYETADSTLNDMQVMPVNQSDYSYCEEAEEEKRFAEAYDGHPAAKISFRSLVINMAVSFAAVIGCMFVCLWYELGEREMICLCAALMVALIVFSFCGVQLIWKKFLQKQQKAVLYSGNIRQQPKGYRYSYEEEKAVEESHIYGNTVFIPWTENSENKLYGMGKGNKNHIDLSHLPVTVGKLAGSVDMVINEQSISRRHVKFFRENGHICMTDLNSTNGTFKNGMRLLPNASEILEPGDEIRLGKLNFIYR